MKQLHDKLIAVVGVSSREDKIGYKIFKDLLSHGFQVKPVNPRGGEVLGQKVYKDLRDMEQVPDLVITVVVPEVTEKVVDICKSMGIRQIWMQPGSESEAAIKKARSYGIEVTSNACFMVQAKIW
jgi:uncharacterized protein